MTALKSMFFYYYVYNISKCSKTKIILKYFLELLRSTKSSITSLIFTMKRKGEGHFKFKVTPPAPNSKGHGLNKSII